MGMLAALDKAFNGMQELALERLVEALQEQQSADGALEAAQQVSGCSKLGTDDMCHSA